MPINFSTNKDLLTELGYGSGGINDGWFQYLGSLGYTGSLDDRWRKFLREEFPDRADASLGDLANGVSVTDPFSNILSLESGDKILLESGDFILLEAA